VRVLRKKTRTKISHAQEAELIALLTERLGAVVGEWGTPFKDAFGDPRAERPMTLDGVSCPPMRTQDDLSFEIADVEGRVGRVRALLAEAGFDPTEASNR
jgi:hypothetical protein